MRVYLAAVLAVGVAAASPVAADTAPPPRPAGVKLPGEWDGVYEWTTTSDIGAPAWVTITVAGGEWTHTLVWTVDGNTHTRVTKSRMTPRPDVGGKHRAFDLTGEAEHGRPVPGIYKAEGGTLTVALWHRVRYVEPSMDRPAGFAPGENVGVFELKRVEKK